MTRAPSATRPYAICANCIMDTSDSNITFDARGWCDYCNNYHQNILPNWHPDERGARELARDDRGDQARRARAATTTASSASAAASTAPTSTYLAKEKFGLRPLLLPRRRRLELAAGGQQHREAGRRARPRPAHRGRRLAGDAGPAARVLQGAGAAPRHAAGSRVLRRRCTTSPRSTASSTSSPARNYSTECVREPLEWHYHASDLRQLKDIHRRFGTRPLKTFPLADIFTYKLYYRFVKGVRVVKPLELRALHQGGGDAGAGRPLRLAALRAQALRVALHAVLRGLLAADEVRLRQAPRALLEPDPDRSR